MKESFWEKVTHTIAVDAVATVVIMVIGGVAVWFWGLLAGLADPIKFLVAIWAIITFGLISWFLISFIRRIFTPRVRFYTSRHKKNEKWGDLAKELASVSNAWVAFENGHYFNSISEQLHPKISRMVLLDPYCDALKTITAMVNYSEDVYVSDILQATQSMTSRFPTENRVRYTDKPFPFLNCIIGNPEGPNAWARVQAELPYTRGNEWPNYVVYEKKEPQLFATIKSAYSEMWNGGKTPTSQQSNPSTLRA